MAGKLCLVALLFAAASTIDPMAIVEPSVSLSAADRDRLARGELVSRVLPARKGQVAVFAVTRIAAEPETLIAAARDITDLKKSPLVLAIGRFSDPPQLSDLDALTLDAHDRDVLAACEPRRCSFKLAAIEIEAIKRDRHSDVDGDRITMALRRVMWQRVHAYLSAGLAALPPIANRSTPWQLHEVLAAAQTESPRLLQSPPLASWIGDEPERGSLESFVYWSKELFGSGKPVILITHVAIHRPAPGTAVVVGKQIFASRYINGALSMSALTTADGGQRYLVYLNRTTVDVLGGVFGGIKRAMLESRLSGEMPELIARLRDRLERSRYVSRTDPVRHH